MNFLFYKLQKGDLRHFYSTVTEKSKNVVKKIKPLSEYDEILLYLKVSITTPRLTKIHHYTKEQKRVFKIVKHLREYHNYSYVRIKDFLNENNFKTTRTKKEFKSQDVYSVYKKGLIREKRIGRKIETKIERLICIIPGLNED